jgi:hypothetical protein
VRRIPHVFSDLKFGAAVDYSLRGRGDGHPCSNLERAGQPRFQVTALPHRNSGARFIPGEPRSRPHADPETMTRYSIDLRSALAGIDIDRPRIQRGRERELVAVDLVFRGIVGRPVQRQLACPGGVGLSREGLNGNRECAALSECVVRSRECRLTGSEGREGAGSNRKDTHLDAQRAGVASKKLRQYDRHG